MTMAHIWKPRVHGLRESIVRIVFRNWRQLKRYSARSMESVCIARTMI